MFYIAILCTIFFAELIGASPFIATEILNHCFYNTSKGITTFSSKLWEVESESFVLFYKLCDPIPENIKCGSDVVACLKNKTDNSTRILGKKFIIRKSEGLLLETINGDLCKGNSNKLKLGITFSCSEGIKETSFEVVNNCEFKLLMRHPSCKPMCTTEINDQLYDLRPLNKEIMVYTNQRNFTVNLCGTSNRCNEGGVTSCETTGNVTTALSNLENEEIRYDNKLAEIVIHGSQGSRKGKKKFELTLKCDWESNNTFVKFINSSRKGYRFEMESSYGCIKIPPMCIINSNFYIYNLTNLYKKDGYLEVSGVPNGKHMFLNICGNLHLNSTKNACSKSYSQVCETNGTNYINRGSIFTTFEISDDVISTKIVGGARCSENSSIFYNTHIQFFCSKYEEGPRYVNYEKCNTFIIWNTPQACPKANKDSCSYVRTEIHNCTVYSQGLHYDLSKLRLNSSSYEVKDPTDNNLVYLLNVCSSVFDPESPCIKGSMVLMKNVSLYNVKQSVKSLGKMFNISHTNKSIMIIALSGSYCDGEDYHSTVQFICSKMEEGPKLLNRTKCRFTFQWKTPYACPLNIPSESPQKTKHCIITDPINSKITFDFGKLKQKSMKIDLNDSIYTFNFCYDNYTECIQNDCSSSKVIRKIQQNNGKISLTINLPRTCNAETDINKAIFELDCDEIKNNEHFILKERNNCSLIIQLKTHLLCTKEDMIIVPYMDEPVRGNTQIILQEHSNCSVVNQYTGYQFDIKRLQLDLPTSNCPKISFNNEKNFVTMEFFTSNVCKDSNKNDIYNVILNCSEKDVKTVQKSECAAIYRLENPEYCKLFEKSIFDKHSTTDSFTSKGWFVSILVIFALVLCGFIIFILHKYKTRQRRMCYENIYYKDGDM